MVPVSALADGWFDEEWQARLPRRMGRAMAVSFALHLLLLIVVAWVRLPHHGERPLASIEVALNSLPTSPPKVVEPPKSPPKPVEQPKPALPPKAVEPPKNAPKAVEQPKPARPPEAAPLPVQPVQKAAPSPGPVPSAAPLLPARTASVPLVPERSSNDVMRDVMKGIELPPDAPKFGDLSPTQKPKKAQLKLPDVPVVSETKEPAAKPADLKPRPSLAEDLGKELDEELKKLRKVEVPRPAPVAPPPSPASQPAPQMEAKAPSVKAVETTLKVPGMAPGSNAYLARVRQRISSFWNAPPVDVTGQTYVVVVQFRLHRNGSVTGVAIERSSGNEYYDLAGKRAVISATPLPMFPAEIAEPYFDAHFTFTVGESQG